jgi:hypothetical protein
VTYLPPMPKIASTVEIYSTGRHTRHPSPEELWVEGITPLVLEAFAIFIWTTPMTNSFLGKVPAIADSYMLTALLTALFVSVYTFLLNICIHPYVHTILARTSVCDSPLFRTIWIFICAYTATRYTGAPGIMQFTIVTLVPLIYVHVSDKLAAYSAIYASAFLILGVGHGVAFFGAKQSLSVETQHTTVHLDATVVATHSIVFMINSLYHTLWFSSHRHTSDPAVPPCLSYFLFPWDKSKLKVAGFRALLVMTAVLGSSGRMMENPTITYRYHRVVEFFQIVSLFVTISTFTAWTHCQHKYHNRLRTILCASITSATAGMLVDTMEQQLFMWALFLVGIVFDVVYTIETPKEKEHEL